MGEEHAVGSLQKPTKFRDGEQAGQPRPGTANPLGLRTLVTRTHRMTLSPDDKFGELYDLSNDPDENLNIFEDPKVADTRAALMEIMVRRMMQLLSLIHISEPTRRTPISYAV